MKRCHRCGTEWVSEKRQPGVKETCPKCSAYLHCCRNCRFHDKTQHNECRIPNTEWVGDRVGLNFCDEFEFADTTAAIGEDKGKKKARDAFGALFGNAAPSADKDAKQLDEFKKLFGK